MCCCMVRAVQLPGMLPCQDLKISIETEGWVEVLLCLPSSPGWMLGSRGSWLWVQVLPEAGQLSDICGVCTPLLALRSRPSSCQSNPVGTKDLFISVLQLPVPNPDPAEGCNKTLIDYHQARIQPTQPSRMRSKGWRRRK